MASITIPRVLFEELRRCAEESGQSIEELLMDLITQDLDPEDRARRYITAAQELVEQAHEELRKGDLRQAAEKIWGAAVLAVKAYACAREGRRLASHRELWEYKDRIAEELGDWVRSAWMYANSMHTCFYEGWCTEKDIATALEEVEKLVKAISEVII